MRIMKIRKSFCFALSASALMLMLTACGGPSVQSIEVTTPPEKTEYAIGEDVSFAGGEITVTYDDGSTSTVSMDDEGVTYSDVKTDSAGRKNITVSYGGERTRFDLTVDPFVVSFDLGGQGSMDPIEVEEVGVIEDMPADPQAEGYTFDGWYYNQELSDPFDPAADVTADMTLYAKWMNDGANYHTITFDLNYYGSAEPQQLSVEENTAVSMPADPERNGYQFNGWFTDEQGTQAFDPSAAVSGDQTVYASWTRTASGTAEYVFEAEDIDLTGKKGNGYSGEQEGTGLIQTEAENSQTQASNNRFVGYTYTPGLTLDFHIVSDSDVSDATIVARLSGEFADFTLTPSMFNIILNDEPIDYGRIEIKGVPSGGVKPFEDYVLITNATLKEGENHLSFVVNNDENWIGGGTVAATAPLLDNVKITTSAVLWWNGDFGLPMDNY